MLWFEEHPIVEEKYRKKCPYCKSKDILGTGGFFDDIRKKSWDSYKCKKCREDWAVKRK